MTGRRHTLVLLPLAAAVAASALVAAAVAPAAADHVTPRDIADACPPDRPGADDERYSDVTGTTFEAEIACVSDYRIALGTGDGRYAPSAPITRQQMALFLFRLALSAHLPLQAANNQFSDVDQLPQDVRDAINVIGHLGIAQGVDGDRFVPGGTVSRGQMASFLNRFHAVATGTEGFPAGSDAFDDDNGSVHEPAIDAAAAGGLAAGLGGEQDRLFAPMRPLTRGQMAGFLARLLDAEVEAGAIGPRFVEPEQVDGVVVSDTDTRNRIGVDTDGDGAADRVVFYDGNDDYLFGDRRGDFAELRLDGPVFLLSPGDVVSVSYLPNFFDTSTVQVVDDLVGTPSAALATAVVGADGAQDDVRLIWQNIETEQAVIERFRSPVGADGACPTDGSAYVADGAADGPRGRSALFNPGSEPPITDPTLTDEGVSQEGCYRYGIRSVSAVVEGSTPADHVFTNAVLVDGTVDTEEPQLTSRQATEREDGSLEVELVFDNERRVLPAAAGRVDLFCSNGTKNGYTLGLALVEAAGSRLTYESAPLYSGTTQCGVYVSQVGVVDDRGNPNTSNLGGWLE